MTSGQAILQIFNFFISQIGKAITVMDSFEFLPNISYWDLVLTLCIISILIKFAKFGIDKKEIISSLLTKKSKDNYEPKHAKEE